MELNLIVQYRLYMKFMELSVSHDLDFPLTERCFHHFCSLLTLQSKSPLNDYIGIIVF